MAAEMGANSEPEEALKRLADHAPLLYPRVHEALEGYRGSVRSAYEQLRSDYAVKQNRIDILESEAAKLMHHMPVLMLSPGGPFQQILEEIVRDLEKEFDFQPQLRPKEDSALMRIKQLIEELRKLNSHSDRIARLALVARIIDQYNEHLPSQSAQADQSRRTLN